MHGRLALVSPGLAGLQGAEVPVQVPYFTVDTQDSGTEMKQTVDQRRRTRVRNNAVRGWRDGQAVKKHSGNILEWIFFGPLFTLWLFAALLGLGFLAAWILNSLH